MAFFRQQVFSRRREQANATGRLGVLEITSKASHVSGLITTPRTPEERILVAKVEYFERLMWFYSRSSWSLFPIQGERPCSVPSR